MTSAAAASKAFLPRIRSPLKSLFKKVILFLIAASTAEVLVLLSALFLGYPLPLAAVQILWINFLV